MIKLKLPDHMYVALPATKTIKIVTNDSNEVEFVPNGGPLILLIESDNNDTIEIDVMFEDYKYYTFAKTIESSPGVLESKEIQINVQSGTQMLPIEFPVRAQRIKLKQVNTSNNMTITLQTDTVF